MLNHADAPRPHPATLPDEELLKLCTLGKSRGSGPGGQHRNKVETKVTLTHTPTGITAQAGERRKAEDNRRVALFRLRLALATQARAPVPPGDTRSDLWKSRCPGTPPLRGGNASGSPPLRGENSAGRISCNPSHRDYPALLAEALDMVHACGLDPKTAALRLECSPSQLIKLVKDHPAALEAWNRARSEAGLHPLK